MSKMAPDETTFVDVSHTSHSRANTGIQRVCRSLIGAVGSDHRLIPICFDPYYRAWRRLTIAETRNIRWNPCDRPSDRRRAHWDACQKGYSNLRRCFPFRPYHPLGEDPRRSRFLFPEIFSADCFASSRTLRMDSSRPHIALFYDAVALRFPHLAAPEALARFPNYLTELASFDGIAAISAASRDELSAWWRNNEIRDAPPIEVIPLATIAVESGSDLAEEETTVSDPPIILMVATLEGRKNHLALLEAAVGLWDRNLSFVLQLIGSGKPDSGQLAQIEIRRLQQAGYPIKWDGTLTDRDLTRAYRRSYCTIYPSLYEGFGMPVEESLRFSRPCICTPFGALEERAQGGGCLLLKSGESVDIAAGIERLLTDCSLYGRLCQEAQNRDFTSWSQYLDHLLGWMKTL